MIDDSTSDQKESAKPFADAAGSATVWIPLTMDNPPPEGRRVYVLLDNGCEHYATRKGNAIHVGVPDSFNPNAVAWRPDDESPNEKRSDASDAFAAAPGSGAAKHDLP